MAWHGSSSCSEKQPPVWARYCSAVRGVRSSWKRLYGNQGRSRARQDNEGHSLIECCEILLGLHQMRHQLFGPIRIHSLARTTTAQHSPAQHSTLRHTRPP